MNERAYIPYPYQYLWFSVFWILAFLIGVLYVIIVLICNSLISDDVEFFLYTYFPSVYLLSEVSVKVFGRFKIVSVLLCLKSFLYILNSSPLLDIPFPNIFSQSLACFFILLTFFILMNSSLQIASFVNHTFSIVSKNTIDFVQQIYIDIQKVIKIFFYVIF